MTQQEMLDYHTKQCKGTVRTAMIEFAKYHVKKALKAALEDCPAGSSTDIPSYDEVKKAILNSYPLNKIK